MAHWKNCYGPVWTAITFGGGGNGLWWLADGKERCGIDTTEFGGPKLPQIRVTPFADTTGQSHGPPPPVRETLHGDEKLDAALLTADGTYEYGKWMGNQLLKH